MEFYKKLTRRLCTALAAVLLVAAQSVAQTASSRNDAQVVKPDGQPPVTIEQKISSKEADELFRSVDEILEFASKDTALPIKHKVKRTLTSRDAVADYITKHLSEDEDSRRLRRSERVLKKFGLLPHDFDLGSFLIALLREQVAGYYDPKTRTVNLLDWVDIEQQRPVLAHELTHALQDQSFDLEKWMKVGSDLTENNREPTAADFENDEIASARQAVVEGQAMAVLLDYELAPMGKSILNSQQIVDAMKQGMLEGTADSLQFRNAPIFWKESMTFPYRYGMDFVLALLKMGGKDKAFAGALANPPHSTRQIMEPSTYLSGEQIEPMRLPDFKQIFKDYDRFDVGSVGEFDVAALIEQYSSLTASKNMYPHWRGGYYYAVQPKALPAAALGLLYVSRWSDAESAAQFAAIYARAIPQRYKQVKENSPDPAGDLATLQSLSGNHSWATEEGMVVIEAVGDMVMITESLSAEVTDRLGHDVFSAIPVK